MNKPYITKFGTITERNGTIVVSDFAVGGDVPPGELGPVKMVLSAVIESLQAQLAYVNGLVPKTGREWPIVMGEVIVDEFLATGSPTHDMRCGRYSDWLTFGGNSARGSDHELVFGALSSSEEDK